MRAREEADAVRQKEREADGRGFCAGRMLRGPRRVAVMVAGWISRSIGVHDSCLLQRRVQVCAGARAGHAYPWGWDTCLNQKNVRLWRYLRSGGVEERYRRMRTAPVTPALAFHVASDGRRKMQIAAIGIGLLGTMEGARKGVFGSEGGHRYVRKAKWTQGLYRANARL